MFIKKFDRHVCQGDTISCEVDGFDVTARVYRDDCQDRPDEHVDGFWPSLDPVNAGYIGPKSKRTLARHKAKAQSVMDAWLNDEWWYCGVAVTVSRAGVPLTGQYSNALWGIEANYPDSDNAYLTEVANQYIREAISEANEKIDALLAGIR